MLRHVIAPAHSFAQIPNVILRHPRLSSDAKNLLNWQLSLPSDERQCLSETARKAGIKKCAFQKAKRQLLDEGYLHQWTVQREGGRFATVQLVSNTPLAAKEALAVRDGLRPAPGGWRLTADAGGGEGGQPTAVEPTAGEPTGPAVGRLPEQNTGENTTQPAGGDGESANEPDAGAEVTSGGLAAAEALLLSLGRLDPDLAMPVRTARTWAPLAAKWLDSGMSPLRARQILTDGLETARKPLGALRWRLEHTLPEEPTPPPPSPAVPKPEPRITGMRECRARHTQPRLFTPPPGSDEDLCPDCRVEQDVPREGGEAPPAAEERGYAAFLAARRDERARPRRRRGARR